jgi:hypothetical protein
VDQRLFEEFQAQRALFAAMKDEPSRPEAARA